MGLSFSALHERELLDLVETAQASPANNLPEMGEIVRRFRGQVEAIGRRVCFSDNDRDDVVSEMLMEVVRSVRAHDLAREGFVTFLLFRVAARGRRVSMRLAEVPGCLGNDVIRSTVEQRPEGVAPSTDSVNITVFGDLTGVVRALPERQKTAVYLHIVEGHPVGEVARMTGVTPAAISQRLGSAYKALLAQVA